MTWLGVGKRPFQLHLRTSSFGPLVASALSDEYFKICIAMSRLKKLEFRARWRISTTFAHIDLGLNSRDQADELANMAVVEIRGKEVESMQVSCEL